MIQQSSLSLSLVIDNLHCQQDCIPTTQSVKNTPFMLQPTGMNSYIFYKECAEGQQNIEEIDVHGNIIKACKLEQGSKVIKVFLMNDHIVTIFYIIPTEVINQRIKLRIIHWNLETDSMRRHRYITEYNVNMESILMGHSSTTLQQQKRIKSLYNKLSIFTFSQSSTYCICEVCKDHIKVAYFKFPNLSAEDEAFEVFTLFDYSTEERALLKLNNHSKIGLLNKSIIADTTVVFPILELNKLGKGVYSRKCLLRLPKLSKDPPLEQKVTLLNAYQVGCMMYMKVGYQREIKHYLLESKQQSITELRVKAELDLGYSIAQFCTPDSINMSECYEISQQKVWFILAFIDKSTCEILYKSSIRRSFISGYSNEGPILIRAYDPTNLQLIWANQETSKIHRFAISTQYVSYRIMQTFLLEFLINCQYAQQDDNCRFDHDLIFQTIEMLRS